jgi:hypothetical protein
VFVVSFHSNLLSLRRRRFGSAWADFLSPIQAWDHRLTDANGTVVKDLLG